MFKIYLLLFAAVIFNTSCRSYREATLFLDINKAGQVDSKMPATGGYRLQPDDNLYISVLSSNMEMNRVYNPAQSGSSPTLNYSYGGEENQHLYGYRVDNQGNIELPLLGSFNVIGKTLEETEALIQKKAQGLFKEVSTKIRLLNYKITVVGEVKKPGVFFNYSDHINVLDVIGRAEGLTEFALIEEVLVLRPTNGKQEAYLLNLNNRSALLSDGFYLFPNDMVVIKPAKNKNRQLRSQAQNWIIPAISAALVLANLLRDY